MPHPDTKILIVEDNDLDVEVVQRALRRLSLDLPLVRAKNGEEALALLRGADTEDALAPPFAVVLDINMPRMNGFELLDEIADDESLKSVPVFVLSTSSNPKDRDTAERYGIRGYLVKPITGEALLDIVESATADDGADPPSDRSRAQEARR